MMLPRAFASAVLLLSLGLAHAAARDDYRRLTALDAAHYLIRLAIEEAGEEIGAETEITFAANCKSSARGHIIFDIESIVPAGRRQALPLQSCNGP